MLFAIVVRMCYNVVRCCCCCCWYQGMWGPVCFSIVPDSYQNTKCTSPTRGSRLLEMCVSPRPQTTFQNMFPVLAKRTFAHATFSNMLQLLLGRFGNHHPVQRNDNLSQCTTLVVLVKLMLYLFNKGSHPTPSLWMNRMHFGKI